MRRAGTDERPILRLAGHDGREAAEALRGAGPARASRRRARRSARTSGTPRISRAAGWSTATVEVGRVRAPGRAALVRGARGRARRRGGPARAARARRRALGRRRGAASSTSTWPSWAKRARLPSAPSRCPAIAPAPDAARRRHALPGVVRVVPRPAPRRATRCAHGHELRTLNPREHTSLQRRPGRRHAVRRRRRDGAARRRHGRGAARLLRRRSRRAARPAPRDRADARRADARRQLRRRARGRAGDHAAVRALRGLRRAHRRSTSPPTRCRSGATCSRAASWRRWSSWTRCCASCPARSGHADSALEESFSAALGGDPEYPHYTRPAEYRGWKVPEVLLSGHHEEIRQWRRARSRERGAASGGSSLP